MVTAVQQRASMVLEFLIENGPSVITKIAQALMMAIHLVRYALVTLRESGLAHISEFIQEVTSSGLVSTAVFAAGPGEDAILPYKDPRKLSYDWDTGRHLQPIYMEWAATRTPPYEVEQ